MDIPADAGVKIYPSAPALGGAGGDELCAAFDKLMRQFQREGNVGEWWTMNRYDGALIVVAWTDAGPEGLSGCRKDKMAKVAALHGGRVGSDLLAPPPIWLDGPGGPQGIDGAEFKALVEAGSVDADTPAFDTMATKWAAWSAAAPAPLGTIPWLERKLARILRKRAG